MSRYTASELYDSSQGLESLSNLLTSKDIPKAALVECIARQPEIQFPRKISCRPLEEIPRKHLIRALTGNFGYIKPVVSCFQDTQFADFIPLSG